MYYQHIKTGTFLKRSNRFIASVLTDGREVICHVKNTGRLRELLTPGAQVILEFHPDAGALGRKTSYSLIGVYKENAGLPRQSRLINIDSQAPNQAAAIWLSMQKHIDKIRREVTFGDSRFDLAFEACGQPGFMEVKGVTLEAGGVAMFPDAPTKRGVKHVKELIRAKEEGYPSCLLFVIQMDGIKEFTPNRSSHPEFADILKQAEAAGVRLLAYDCKTTPEALTIHAPVPIRLC